MKGLIFFRGMPLEPPLAGINPSIFIVKYAYILYLQQIRILSCKLKVLSGFVVLV